MPRPKKIEPGEVTSSEEVLKREQLKALLAKRLPTMFDRDPVITGNLDALVDDIYKWTS